VTTIPKRPTTVVVRGGGSAVIRLSRDTVAKIKNNRPNVAVAGGGSTIAVQDRRSVVRTGGAMGVQGPQGEPGLSGGGTISPIAFSYGDASSAVYIPSADGTLTVARLVITTPFDGAGAHLALGTLAVPGAALATTDSDPATAGEYEVTADLELSAGEALRLTITPGAAATAGAGLLYLTFIPTA
jgi:hypothetical protein